MLHLSSVMTATERVQTPSKIMVSSSKTVKTVHTGDNMFGSLVSMLCLLFLLAAVAVKSMTAIWLCIIGSVGYNFIIGRTIT